MLLSEKDFLNYIKCPLYYRLEARGTNLQKKTFNSLLHDVANEYIRRVANEKLLGNFNHENYVKKHWDKTCLLNQNIITDKQCIQGWGYLFTLKEFISKSGVEVLDTDMTYIIEPEGRRHALTGQLDPILKMGDFYTTFIISFSDKLPESYVLDMNLKHTIDSYALNQLIPGIQHCTTYHSFKSGAEKDTLRFNAQWQRLENILETVGDCIEQDLIYPRNGYHCSTCNMRGLCSTWGGEIDGNKRK